MDNQTIVATLQSNEEQGYQLLIQQYVRYVMAILTGVTKNMLPTEDIEEMAADVFFTIWKRRDTLQILWSHRVILQAAPLPNELHNSHWLNASMLCRIKRRNP